MYCLISYTTVSDILTSDHIVIKIEYSERRHQITVMVLFSHIFIDKYIEEGKARFEIKCQTLWWLEWTPSSACEEYFSGAISEQCQDEHVRTGVVQEDTCEWLHDRIHVFSRVLTCTDVLISVAWPVMRAESVGPIVISRIHQSTAYIAGAFIIQATHACKVFQILLFLFPFLKFSLLNTTSKLNCHQHIRGWKTFLYCSVEDSVLIDEWKFESDPLELWHLVGAALTTCGYWHEPRVSGPWIIIRRNNGD